jgi:triacylglycerol esterase/lipase EstA (alpha/beta hydrolase family)
MNAFFIRPSLILLAALLLCHCGAPQPPQCRRVPMASRAPAGSLIASARKDWATLGDPSRKSQWPAAQASYNTAVARLFDQLCCGPGDWHSRAARLGTRIAPAGGPQVDLEKLDAVFPASRVNAHKVAHHQTTDGVGVPAVGWKKTTAVGIKRAPHLLPNGLPYNITALLEFDRSGNPVWQFSKRWLYDDLTIGNASHTLAADWTASNAFYWQMCQLDDLKIQNVILPDRFSEEIGLYFLQPYDPEKIPLVFVHGLVSSPDAFKNIINDLAPEPWFRARYQVWLFNYPTGNPWLYSGMRFRQEINAACAHARTRGDDTNLNKMVIVGHSMGGLVSRSSVTEPGTKFYDAVFKAPLQQLRVSAPVRKLIEDATLYQPLKEPERVVFLAVPHRGSPLATLKVSVWISHLIRLPKKLTVELLDATAQGVNNAMKGDQAKPDMPNSISSLSPKDKSNLALSSMPLPRRIKFHSVIGDRGRGDLPNSSDGVVPYWSSHVGPVESELIVPSNHSVPGNDQAAAEVKRILKLHLQK